MTLQRLLESRQPFRDRIRQDLNRNRGIILFIAGLISGFCLHDLEPTEAQRAEDRKGKICSCVMPFR